jgi:hypothetical protein
VRRGCRERQRSVGTVTVATVVAVAVVVTAVIGGGGGVAEQLSHNISQRVCHRDVTSSADITATVIVTAEHTRRVCKQCRPACVCVRVCVCVCVCVCMVKNEKTIITQ